MLSDLLFRLRAIFRRNAVEEDLDDELRFHFEREVEKLVASGVNPEDASRRAKLAIGGMDQVKEECRQARGVTALETVFQDLRYAARSMRHSPGFTVAAVLTLGFGAAAVSTVFTLANTLLFRQFPVAHPDRVVTVQATRRHGRLQGWVSYPDYVHFRDGTKTLEGLALHYSTAPLFVTAGNRSREVNGAVVSANFLPLLGATPALGRFFRADEDKVPDRDPVAVLSYDFWRDWFGASPDVVGATLKVNGVVFTAIGVAPRDFRGITVSPDEIYIPAMMARAGYRWCADAFAVDCTVFDMIGRLRDGYSVEQSRAEFATLMPASWAKAPEGENTGITVFHSQGVIDPNRVHSSQVRFIGMLTSLAAVLLLVCCANLAGLLIARNGARTREFAIRASLGAGSLRLMRQLLTEPLLLAVLGGATGIVLSLALTGMLNASFYSIDGEGHPLYYNFSPALGVMLAVVAVSSLAGLLASLIPALRSIRSDAADSLKRESQTVSSIPRLGRWLAGAQAGVALALAVVAGLLTTSAQLMMGGTNFDPSHIALMRLRPRLLKYPPQKAQRFMRTVMERVNAAPGVESASMVGTGSVLLGTDDPVSLPGCTGSQGFESFSIDIGPRYFETLQIPVVRGREFDDRDNVHSAPVAIVNEALAHRLWPAGRVIGATLLVNKQPRQVIGIVKDLPLQNRGEPDPPAVYTPFWQNPLEVDARLLVRVKGDPAAAHPQLMRIVNRIDPDVPIAETITLRTQLAGMVRSLRVTASFASYAAILAILLSAIGLYGTLAFSISRRTKEIGIRMAVGARPSSVLAMVVREGMRVVIAGSIAGIFLAVGAARVVRYLLYGPSAMDAPLYVVAVLIVGLAGLLACWIPARRAASLEPLAALREQ